MHQSQSVSKEVDKTTIDDLEDLDLLISDVKFDRIQFELLWRDKQFMVLLKR